MPFWRRSKKKPEQQQSEPERPNLPKISFYEGEHPWGVPLLDVSPITGQMISTSGNVEAAANAMSYGGEDGSSFENQGPDSDRVTDVSLEFRCAVPLLDGTLHLPERMEDKWAIFLRNGRIIFIRSWMRKVFATADYVVAGDRLTITNVAGDFGIENADVAFYGDAANFLIQSHVMSRVYPAPLPTTEYPDVDDSEELERAALWCFTHFGDKAILAAPCGHVAQTVPDDPIAPFTTFHMAIAEGDRGKVTQMLDDGIPVDLPSPGGGSALSHAVILGKIDVAYLLIDRGADINHAADNGATALHDASANGRTELVAKLLEAGADPNAKNEAELTALHGVGVTGFAEIGELLINAGAELHPVARGKTPREVAVEHKQDEIVQMIDKADAARV